MKKSLIFNLFILSFLLLFSAEKLFSQTAKVTVNADPKIEELLRLKMKLVEDNKLADGYTIQLYYGELNQANSIIKSYRNSFGTWPASIEYETPNYKVWAGNFSTRLEADRALMEIVEKFSSAFILEKKK